MILGGTSVDPSILTVPVAEAAPLVLNSTSTIAAYVAQQAALFGVPEEKALYIAKNESGFIAISIGDMNLICKGGINKGKPVRARGLFQITECSHPEVTDQEAYDPVWATAWAMPRLKDRTICEKEWTTCRNYYSD